MALFFRDKSSKVKNATLPVLCAVSQRRMSRDDEGHVTLLLHLLQKLGVGGTEISWWHI